MRAAQDPVRGGMHYPEQVLRRHSRRFNDTEAGKQRRPFKSDADGVVDRRSGYNLLRGENEAFVRVDIDRDWEN